MWWNKNWKGSAKLIFAEKTIARSFDCERIFRSLNFVRGLNASEISYLKFFVLKFVFSPFQPFWNWILILPFRESLQIQKKFPSRHSSEFFFRNLCLKIVYGKSEIWSVCRNRVQHTNKESVMEFEILSTMFFIHIFLLLILGRVLQKKIKNSSLWENISITSIYRSAYLSRHQKALITLIKGSWAKEIRGRWKKKRPDVGHHHYHWSSK